jgi:DNA-binding HxlR family transcriptional regulator
VAKSSAAIAAAPAKKGNATAPALPTEIAGTHLASVDELIHERIRLGIVSALAVNDSLSFKELKTILQTTDGNLSVHARKLETAGYVAAKKTFEKRIPKTEYKITPTGRRMFEKYLNHMEALIQAIRPR